MAHPQNCLHQSLSNEQEDKTGNEGDLLSSLGVVQVSEGAIRRCFVNPLCEQRDEERLCGFGGDGRGPHLPVSW